MPSAREKIQQLTNAIAGSYDTIDRMQKIANQMDESLLFFRSLVDGKQGPLSTAILLEDMILKNRQQAREISSLRAAINTNRRRKAK